MSVSRSLKPFGDPNRPSDWFHQKNCAAQYGALLENVETPKRKKRTSGPEAAIETPTESILRKLKMERLAELKKLIHEERAEYYKLQEDMALLQSGNVNEEQLDRWCKEIDEEEKEKEQEALAHAKWLKERELRKQEIERVWRPVIKTTFSNNGSQKRKPSDTIEGLIETDSVEETPAPALHVPEPGKSAQSPLLTSLLKSPSHAQNVVTSSILHTAITSQRPTTTNPTIASLLNSSTNVTVSASLQQLVSSAIGQEPTTTIQVVDQEPTTPELPDDAVDILPNLKVEDIESTLPEIKNEEVEGIISDLIENAEIVTDPEEHLALTDNIDLMDNLENELQELVKEEEENAAKESQAVLAEIKHDEMAQQTKEQAIVEIDPFEFQEEPEIYEHTQPPKITVEEKQIIEDVKEEVIVEDSEATIESMEEIRDVNDLKKECIGGSVEIVEVVAMEDEEIDKELNKSEIEDIVHSSKVDLNIMKDLSNDEQQIVEIKTDKDSCDESNTESVDMEVKSESEALKEVTSTETTETDTNEGTGIVFTPDFTGELYDDNVSMEVKVDKSGKAKRDYSRTKKKEDKDLDIYFNVEQVQLEEEQETCSEKEFQEIEKKLEIKKLKNENERSNSPWTEEDEIALKGKRRYSTPATPIDSIPNSPGSTTTNEDEREYRNWKKSLLLVYNRLATHKYASLFLKPITNDQAPGYHNIVYRPMDLQAIRKNIDNGTIRTTTEFQRDVLLMFTNAIMYNKTNDLIYNMARQMQQESIQQIQLFQQAQMDTPARRETRTSEPGGKRKRAPEEVSRSKKRKED
ncbi:putative bromo domain protein [Trypoxylus dichotomus]